MTFTETILEWYDQNKRDLPWRYTNEPYKIWLSEVIMQQTQISRGKDYYLKFLEKFPTVFDLADADEKDVLLLWQGLGYYSRARYLHLTANILTEEYKGFFPESYNELIKLKGVGDYIASMILSVSFQKPYPAVDGNILRFISRLQGSRKAINKPEGIKSVKEFTEKFISKTRPGDYNQAMMEFGATFCKKHNPRCDTCIFKKECIAYCNESVSEIPRKEKVAERSREYFNYFICKDINSNKTIIKKRSEGIWKNMFEFPSVVSRRRMSDKTALSNFQKNHGIFKNSILKQEPKEIKHILSHKELYIKFFMLSGEFSEIFTDNINEYLLVKISDLNNFPFPNGIRKFLQNEILL